MTGEVTERPQPTVVLAASTDAGTSSVFRVDMSPVCVSTIGTLGAGEDVTIERQGSSGNWADYIHTLLGVFVLDGDDGETSLTIYDTGNYRAVKTATAGSVGVEILGRNYS
jgi:hypothetical protein